MATKKDDNTTLIIVAALAVGGYIWYKKNNAPAIPKAAPVVQATYNQGYGQQTQQSALTQATPLLKQGVSLLEGLFKKPAAASDNSGYDSADTGFYTVDSPYTVDQMPTPDYTDYQVAGVSERTMGALLADEMD